MISEGESLFHPFNTLIFFFSSDLPSVTFLSSALHRYCQGKRPYLQPQHDAENTHHWKAYEEVGKKNSETRLFFRVADVKPQRITAIAWSNDNKFALGSEDRQITVRYCANIEPSSYPLNGVIVAVTAGYCSSYYAFAYFVCLYCFRPATSTATRSCRQASSMILSSFSSSLRTPARK